MATSIGQYTPVFLPGEPLLRQISLTGHSLQGHEEARTNVTLSTETEDFCFFACGSSAAVTAEHEGGEAAWLAGTLAAPSVQGQKLLSCQELWPYHYLFRTSCSWRSDVLFGQSFSIALPIQTLRGIRCLGSFSVVQRVRYIEDAPDWGPTL